MTPNVRLPGLYMPSALRARLDEILADQAHLFAAEHLPITVRSGGMEDMRSAFLVLSLNGKHYFLVERRRDGEFWPTLLPVQDGVDIGDEIELFFAMSRYAGDASVDHVEWDEIAVDALGEYIGELMWQLLYEETRDVISPDAIV